MVFVRVHLVKGRLSAEQKEQLGAELIQAVSDVEGVVASQRHLEASWVQFIELEPENWYAPANLAGANPGLPDPARHLHSAETTRHPRRSPQRARQGQRGRAVGARPRGAADARAVAARPHHAFDQWAIDGRVPDWESDRAHLRADTPEQAEEALAIVYGPGRHTSIGLSA